MKKFYIFDLDDTLRLGANMRFINTERFELQIPLPKVKEKLGALKKGGAKIFVASNQGGPSFPKATEFSIWKNVIYFNEEILGNLMEDIRFDFYHPKGKVRHRYKNRRKPKPDLILELMKDYDMESSNVIYIGNAPTDKEAAGNAEIDFEWAHDFFGWNKENLTLYEIFGYGWKITALKKQFSQNKDMRERIDKFLELAGDGYQKKFT